MSIRQAEVTDVDRDLINRTLFAQVNYDLDLGQAADRLLADANQAVVLQAWVENSSSSGSCQSSGIRSWTA